MKKIIFFVLLNLLFNFTLTAKKTIGYIVTNSGDSIEGEIRLPIINSSTQAVAFGGFIVENFHNYVEFKASMDKRFKVYKPAELKAFGFIYNEVSFVFRSFEIPRKSLIEGESLESRFLQLTNSANIILYKDRARFYINTGSNMPSSYYQIDYYIFTATDGLCKSEKSAEISTLKDFLLKFDCDPIFVKRISPKTSFNAIEEVLISYDRWIENK